MGLLYVLCCCTVITQMNTVFYIEAHQVAAARPLLLMPLPDSAQPTRTQHVNMS